MFFCNIKEQKTDILEILNSRRIVCNFLIVENYPDIGNKIYRISSIKVDFIAMTTVFVTMKTVIVLNQDGHHG